MISQLRFFLYFKKFHFPESNNENINEIINGSVDITFIFPEENDNISASMIIPEYFKRQGKKVRAVCVNSSGSYLPDNTFDEIVLLQSKEIKKRTVPGSDAVKLLSTLHTNIVVDLSRGEKLFFKYAARSISAAYYIGSEKTDAEKFYHFVFKSDKEIAGEFYNNFLICLQMFNGNT